MNSKIVRAICADDLQAQLAESNSGRILLHLLCAWCDQKYRWHLFGIWREFSRNPFLNFAYSVVRKSKESSTDIKKK